MNNCVAMAWIRQQCFARFMQILGEEIRMSWEPCAMITTIDIFPRHSKYLHISLTDQNSAIKVNVHQLLIKFQR